MDESLKTLAVEDHHRALAGHPTAPNKRPARMAARDDPAEARSSSTGSSPTACLATRRSTRSASVMAEAIFEVQKKGTPFDRDRAVRSLDRLRPEAWRFAP